MASENARSTDPKTAISRERSARSTIVAPAMEPGSSRSARLMTARSVSTKGVSRAIMVRIATCYSSKSLSAVGDHGAITGPMLPRIYRNGLPCQILSNRG
jgi:hypothetical protein